MGKSWSTFQEAAPSWGGLTGIPTDLTDGKITWGEVMDKPPTFPPEAHSHNWQNLENKPFGNNVGNYLVNEGAAGVCVVDADTYGNPVIQFNRGVAGTPQAGVLYLDFAWSDNVDFDVRVAVQEKIFYLWLVNGFNLALIGLPGSSDGLPSGSVYRNGNDLKIV